MEGFFSKEINSSLTKLGIYQTAGGILGIFIIIWAIYYSTLITGSSVLIYLLILLFFSYSIFCGILCIKKNEDALVHSLINQMLQVFGFAIMGFALKYIAGFYLTIGIDLSNSLEFSFGTGISKFDFNFNNQKERLELDVNLIALAFIYWIDKLMQKVKAEEIIRKTSSIGER